MLGTTIILAFRAINRHKLRSFLTTLGIIIGVAADNPIISRNPNDTLDRRQARHFLRIE